MMQTMGDQICQIQSGETLHKHLQYNTGHKMQDTILYLVVEDTIWRNYIIRGQRTEEHDATDKRSITG